MLDARTVLDDAARSRLPARLRTRNGSWAEASFVRVERSGVILTTDAGIAQGEEVLVWFAASDGAYTFEASVLRSGVPVPDRGINGLLLGFIEGFAAAQPEAEPAEGLQIEVLPSHGRGLRLFGDSARLVDLRPQELSFAVPSGVALKFVEGSTVRGRFSANDEQTVVDAEVRELTPTEGHCLYALRFTGVGEDHLATIAAFGAIV